MTKTQITLALPKGRIMEGATGLLEAVGIVPEDDYFHEASRSLRFATNIAGLSIIRVRAFDVATFVAFGAAQIGIVGNDVLLEHDYPDIYAPHDLRIGACRLVVAEQEELARTDDPESWSHIRVATKYPNLTRRHFARRGVQAECIKLSGAMELAPRLGLCSLIVDLVSSGRTLKQNGLVEVETILDVTSRLIVNRTAFKTGTESLKPWMEKFRAAVA